MRRILVRNQKGGSGKSLVTDEVAFFFERTHTPLVFVELDSQGGTIHKTNFNKDAHVVIVDTPGALQAQLRDRLAEADVVVILTKTTSRDIEPLQKMQRAVSVSVRPKTPVLYVLNG